MKIASLLENVTKVRDKRRQYGNIRHKLKDVLVIGLVATLCGIKDFVGMEVFGRAKETWFATFLELPNGIADSETFRRIFEMVNPEELSECLNSWLLSERELTALKQVSVDGKTIRGSGNDYHAAYHVVSAWAKEQGLTLGQVCVDEKSNEITAIPQLLDMIDVSGAVVTIDAMGCQKKIASKIISKKADYLLTLKANHKNMYKSAKELFERIDCGDVEICLDVHESRQNCHGRIETRIVDCAPANLIMASSDWQNLETIVRVKYKSVCAKTGKETTITRYFLTSLPGNARRLSLVIKNHWAIESGLHWALDVIFQEDKSKAKKDNSPLNLNLLRKLALSILIPHKQARISFDKMMLRAALDESYLHLVLFG